MERSGKGTAEISTDVTNLVGKRARSSALILMSAAAKGLAAVDEDLSHLQGAAAESAQLGKEQREKLWKDSLQSRIGRIRESDGLGEQMAKRMDATTKGKWREFKSAMEETGITIGNEILPLLVDLMEDLKPVVIDVAKWAKGHPGVIKAMAKLGMATIALTAIATPILHLSSAFSALTGLGMRGVGGFFGPGRGGGGPRGGGGRPRDARGRYMSWADWEAQQRGRGRGRGRGGGGGLGWGMAPAGGEQPRAKKGKGGGRRARGGRGGGGGALGTALAIAGGWEIGQGLGEWINAGTKVATGRDATDHVVDLLGVMDEWVSEKKTGEAYRREVKDADGNVKIVVGHYVDADELEAMNGGVTGTRGGAEFLSDVNGPTAEGQARLEQLEQEKQLAAELGVRWEVVRRAREQGIGADELRDRGFLKEFVKAEQAKDAEAVRKKKELEQRRKMAGQAAREARQAGVGEGRSEEELQRLQRVAYKRAMGESTGVAGKMFDGVSGAMAKALREVLATELRIKVEGAGVSSAEGEGVNVEGVDTG
jgi:hypothetical protein